MLGAALEAGISFCLIVGGFFTLVGSVALTRVWASSLGVAVAMAARASASTASAWTSGRRRLLPGLAQPRVMRAGGADEAASG